MIRGLILMALLALPARADTTTTNFKFIIPTTGSFNWATKIDDWAVKLDSAAAGLFHNNTWFSSNTYTAPVLMSGTSEQFTGSGGYIVAASSITTTGGIWGGTGVFSQALSSLSMAVSNALTAASGTFTGAVSALTGSFSAGVTSSSGTFTNGVTASSGTFTATGNGQYGLALSTGAQIAHGTLTLTDFANGSSTRCVHVNADGSLTPSSADCGTGSGGGGSLISTGTLGVGATSYTLRNQLKFDAGLFAATDDTAGNATFLTLSTTVAGAVPTRTVFLTGSGTYTTPANAIELRIRECAGGGGGGSSQTGATNGADGSISIFGTIAVSSGIHGLGATGAAYLAGGGGGSGGTGGSGIFVSSSVYRFTGSSGGASGNQSAASAAGYGGGSAFFNGGGQGGAQGSSNVVGGAGQTNSGGGGGGGTNNTNGGGGTGGGGGECAEIIVKSPAVTYPYQVGAGGAGGSGTQSGGAGAAGVIIIEEIYPPSVVLPSTFTVTGSFTATGQVQISTMGVVNFNSGAYTGAGAAFGPAVTGSTISFVTPANSTITVTLQGDISVPNTVLWGTEILVDGALYSATALTSGQTVTSVPSNAGFTRHIFVAAAGSHTFALTLLVGGSTLTFPASAGQATLGQFSAEYNPVRSQ